MTNEKRYEGEAGEPMPTPEAANDAAPVINGGPETAANAGTAQAGATAAADETMKLKAEVADLKDRLLRSHAEMDNVRKRLEREKNETARFAITKFARDIVGIGDNVQRAIEAVPAASVEQDPVLKSLLEGVTMIEREFINVLERHGVKRIDPKGETFNPHLHQAVMEMPDPALPSGTISQVFQAGYTIEERVLRPAMVVVAKGGMKPQAPPAEAASDEAPNGAGSSAQSEAEGKPAGAEGTTGGGESAA